MGHNGTGIKNFCPTRTLYLPRGLLYSDRHTQLVVHCRGILGQTRLPCRKGVQIDKHGGLCYHRRQLGAMCAGRFALPAVGGIIVLLWAEEPGQWLS